MRAGTGVVSLAGAASLTPGEVGGKAASLAQLQELGLQVPPGFVLTTDVWRAVQVHGQLPDATASAVRDAVADLEVLAGRRFGGDGDPLLLAVRSGAAVPMPGMMDTLLDVGFGPGTRDALAATGGDGFARGCHARFLSAYATVVLGRRLPATTDPDELVDLLGDEVPADPYVQLFEAIVAVFGSWDNQRAHAYRDDRGIDHDLGTAVVVQAMVFGNRGAASGSGVASSRDPGTGAPGMCGDFLPASQGDDVVDGAHRPRPLEELAALSPGAHADLVRTVQVIEASCGDLVDVEFAVEDDVLHVLQFRPGARSAAAAVRIAVDLVDEGVIDVAEALQRVSSAQVELAARPAVAPGAGVPIATGLGACPGVATGAICLSPDHVADHDGPVILVRSETSPWDVHGLTASAGALTARGGLVSHAALVARELDLPTVVGVEELRVDRSAGRIELGGRVLREGETITVDGGTGQVHAGEVELVAPAPGSHLTRLRAWRAERPDTA